MPAGEELDSPGQDPAGSTQNMDGPDRRSFMVTMFSKNKKQTLWHCFNKMYKTLKIKTNPTFLTNDRLVEVWPKMKLFSATDDDNNNFRQAEG